MARAEYRAYGGGDFEGFCMGRRQARYAMNVLFAVVDLAREQNGPSYCRDLFRTAIAAILEQYGDPEKMRTLEDSESGIFVANTCAAQSWKVSHWITKEDVLVSFSAPPIPLQRIDMGTYDSEILARTALPKEFASFLPGHFAIRADRRLGLTAWADRLGLARAYYVINDKYLAVSNAIEPLLYFVDGPVEPDLKEWEAFAGFGWFTGDGSPFKGVKRLGAGEMIRAQRGVPARIEHYARLEDLVAPRGPLEPSGLAAAADEMQAVIHNASQILTSALIISLSGGRDSRLTAAAWISTRKPAMIFTNDTISGEALVARDLISRLPFDEAVSGISHNLSEGVDQSSPASPRRYVELSKRAPAIIRYFSGDAAPGALSKRAPVRSLAKTITIGGAGGEIAHGNYYSNPRIFDLIAKSDYSYNRLMRAYPGMYGVTETALAEIDRRLRETHETAAEMGIDKYSRLDFFYLTERFRRWPAAGADTSQLMLYGAPSFVRAAFDATPEQRISAFVHINLTATFIPEWRKVAYFKANLKDQEEVTRKKTRMWQQTDREWLLDTVTYGKNYTDLWRKEFVLERIAEVLRDQGLNWHQSVFQRVIWYETFLSYATEVKNKVAVAHKTLRNGQTVGIL